MISALLVLLLPAIGHDPDELFYASDPRVDVSTRGSKWSCRRHDDRAFRQFTVRIAPLRKSCNN
jgi:hypothetical protein